MNNKFRVWCKNKNQWETDYCVLTSDGVLLHRVRNTWVPLNKDTHIIQFGTGLEDKNGTEIYEGDIIEAENRLWQIGFRDGCFVGVDFKNVAWDELVNIGYGETKVIGNVFEDSELLEVANG